MKNLPWQFPSATNRLVGDQAVGYVNNTAGAQFQLGGLALVDPTTGIAITQVCFEMRRCQAVMINTVWVQRFRPGACAHSMPIVPKEPHVGLFKKKTSTSGYTKLDDSRDMTDTTWSICERGAGLPRCSRQDVMCACRYLSQLF